MNNIKNHICPLCSGRIKNSTICPSCGYDISLDYENYLAIGPIQSDARPLSVLKKEQMDRIIDERVNEIVGKLMSESMHSVENKIDKINATISANKEASKINAVADYQIEALQEENQGLFERISRLEVKVAGLASKVNAIKSDENSSVKNNSAKKNTDSNYEPVVGKIVKFGNYKYYESGEKAPIDWLIVSCGVGTMTLLSVYGIDTHKYTDEASLTTYANWIDSDMRKWLNRDFLNSAFTSEERTAILQNDYSNSIYLKEMSQYVETDSSYDYITLMSSKECTQFLVSVTAVLKPTPYTAKESNLKETCWWWTRTPGTSGGVVGVMADGSLYSRGVNADNAYGVVRPMLTIDLNKWKKHF